MNLQNECKICLQKQIERFLKHEENNILHSTESKKRKKHIEIIESLENEIKILNMQDSPPSAAIKIYKILKEKLKNKDPYESIKKDCNILSKKISANIKPQNLQEAIKAAVIGNAIDYGSESKNHTQKELQNAINQTMEEEFKINDIENFKNILRHAKTILYIADNAGENYFDEILIKFIKQNYNIKVTYLVRGRAIINDLTLKDLKEHKSLFEICDVKSSGVPSPGFIYDLANTYSKKHFREDSIILAKGMGNFECLESTKDRRLFLLFKIKCKVVEKFLNKPLNSLIFLNNC